MENSSLLSRLFSRKSSPARMRPAPPRAASDVRFVARPNTDMLTTAARSPRPARPLTPTPVPPGAEHFAGTYGMKHLQRTLSMALSERGDHVWRLGNHIQVLALLDDTAQRYFGGEANRAFVAYDALSQRTAELLRRTRTGVAAARAEVQKLSPGIARNRDEPGPAAQAFGIDVTLVEYQGLTHEYALLCAQLPARELSRLTAALQNMRGNFGRLLVMPEATGLADAFGAKSHALASQRRLKAAAQACLERLWGRIDAACRARSID